MLRDRAGLDFTTFAAADSGESRSVFRATDQAGAVSFVKVVPRGPDTLSRLRALAVTVTRLRERGYPAPAITAVGELPGLNFWTSERVPGTPLDPASSHADLRTVARFLPQLIALNDAQHGLGAGDAREWPELIARTLTSGGDGYCVHATLSACPGARDVLAAIRCTGERFGADIPGGRDFTHFDFTPSNILSDETSITGVIDINPVVLAGDRAFDLATMLYYCYDDDQIRPALRRRLLDLAAPGVACCYLAHIALRQSDWSLRFYPEQPSTARHLRLAEMAVADINAIAG